MRLSIDDHGRDSAGLTYVYPVVSRRAGGVSVGINLNPNKACNWRCAYCQVDGLQFGNAPEIDLARLEEELDGFLDDLLNGDYFERHVPEGSRVFRDVAFSGDGEPTSSLQFAAAVDVALRVLERHGRRGEVPVIVITNGSLVHKDHVQQGLARLAQHAGRVWYKLDSATEAGQARWNDAHAGVERARENLRLAASLCPTWVQTLRCAWDGEPPPEREQAAYLELLGALMSEGVRLEGVLLYGLARPSRQPEAAHLSALPELWLRDFAARIEALGLTVHVNP